MEYNDVAVWTDLLKILVRSLTSLAQQTNQNVNPSPNFIPAPAPIIVFRQVKHTRQRSMGRDTQVGGGGKPGE